MGLDGTLCVLLDIPRDAWGFLCPSRPVLCRMENGSIFLPLSSNGLKAQADLDMPGREKSNVLLTLEFPGVAAIVSVARTRPAASLLEERRRALLVQVSGYSLHP